MKNTSTFLMIFVLALALAACGSGTATELPGSADPALNTLPADQPPAEAYPYPGIQVVTPIDPWSAEAYPSPEGEASAGFPASCASAEANDLGASIAVDYPNLTTPEQVMTWFCAGAEFEDIMTALETADQTGSPVGDMLAMLAAGLTWEEIWQVVGLTNP